MCIKDYAHSKNAYVLHFCLDYHKLNAVRVWNSHLIPKMDTCIDSLVETRTFSTQITKTGYLLVYMAGNDHKASGKYLWFFVGRIGFTSNHHLCALHTTFSDWISPQARLFEQICATYVGQGTVRICLIRRQYKNDTSFTQIYQPCPRSLDAVTWRRGNIEPDEMR